MKDELDSVNGSPSAVETALLSIWEEVLPLPKSAIGMNTPFVALGGDSLSAMVCINRIRAMFSTELRLVDFLLDDSTICDIARTIAAREAKLP